MQQRFLVPNEFHSMSTIDPNCSKKCLYSVAITNHDNKQLATWVHGTTCPPFAAINYIVIPLPALTKHPHHFFCIESLSNRIHNAPSYWMDIATPNHTDPKAKTNSRIRQYQCAAQKERRKTHKSTTIKRVKKRCES